MAANGTGLSHTTRQTEAVWPDGVADLVPPVAVRVIDLRTPIEGFWLPRTRSWETYRSLLAIGRHDGYPPVLSSFSVGMDGHVSRDRLERGLRRSLEDELHKRRPHWPGDGSFAADEKLLTQRGSPRPALSTPVSVVVPTCANPEQLVPCLRSILRCNYDNLEVIVVENRPGSADTARVLATRFAGETRLRYVEEPRAGASWARNAGLAQAEGELVAFADDDVVVDEAWLWASIAALAREDDIACVTGLILPLKLESETQLLMEQFAGFGKGLRSAVYRLPESRQQDRLFPYTAGSVGSGASTLLRTSVIRELGGYDTALGPATRTTGGEDLDLFIRVLRAGYAVAYEPAAIVWHEHPDGTRQLRRQVYRYGVGLGAMLTKQLVAGPDRRDFLRAVPAGIAYLRNPASRKNAGKPAGYPKHLTWLERAGMLLGPVAYLASVLITLLRQLVRDGRGTRAAPIRSWHRIILANGTTVPLVWFELRQSAVEALHRRRKLRWALPRVDQRPTLVAIVLAIAAPLAVGLGLPTAVRAPIVLAFMCVTPGAAFATAVRARFEPGLIVGVSLAIAAVVAQSMLWMGAWLPHVFLYALAATCLAGLCRGGSTDGSAEVTQSNRAPLLWRIRAAAQSRRRVDVLLAALPGIAIVLWAVALAGTHLERMGGIGLLNALPPTYFVGFFLLVLGFSLAITREDTTPLVLGLYVLALVVVLSATTAILYGEPRYAWTYKHLGVINLIASTGHADRQIDIYNNWPAFFAANAWLSRLTGLQPIAYAGWAQLFFGIVDLAILRFALRGFTRNERLLWCATFFFVLGNWVGQDYLAPQAFGFSLSLLVLGLCVRFGDRRSPSVLPGRRVIERFARRLLPSRRRDQHVLSTPLAPSAAVLAGAICFLAIVTSHQLSPVLLILSVMALAVVARRLPLWAPAAMVAIEVWWVALAWSFLVLHFKVIDLAPAGAAAADRNLSAALPGAALSFYAPVAVMLLVAGLACAGLIRRIRAGYRDLSVVCLMGAPLLGVALQSYGGEGVFRAYLFALPWLAFAAALACTRGCSTNAGARLRVPLLLLAGSAVAVFLLFAYFGQELANRVPRDDVLAATWYEQHAPAGSLRIDVSPRQPARLTARYPQVSLADPSSLLEQAGFTGHRLGPADVPRLQTLIAQQGNHPTYVVVTMAAEGYARLNGLLPSGSIQGLVDALDRSPAFRLVYRRQTAWVFQYVARAGPQGARA